MGKSALKPSSSLSTLEGAKRDWAGPRFRRFRQTAQAFARPWFRTDDKDHLLPVTEHDLPVRVMDTLVVLLTVPEDELFANDDP